MSVSLKQKLKDRLFYIDELRSDECQCGRSKEPRHSLCGTCYFELPKDMQRDLWLPIAGGYEEAYDAAVQYLNS